MRCLCCFIHLPPCVLRIFWLSEARSSVTDLGLGEPLGLVEVFEVVVGLEDVQQVESDIKSTIECKIGSLTQLRSRFQLENTETYLLDSILLLPPSETAPAPYHRNSIREAML